MKMTTLCYLEREDRYLMLHRTRKEQDENKDKWIGIGGKFEAGETPFDCARREIYEETGLVANSLIYKGIVTFVSNEFGTEYMHLFKVTDTAGDLKTNCDEGVLEWVDKDKILDLPHWEGDKYFLELLDRDVPFFSMKLCYRGNTLTDHTIEY